MVMVGSIPHWHPVLLLFPSRLQIYSTLICSESYVVSVDDNAGIELRAVEGIIDGNIDDNIAR